MARTDLSKGYDELTGRLAEEFAETHSMETVVECVTEAKAQFAAATIDSYLSLFIARRARELLHLRPATASVS